MFRTGSAVLLLLAVNAAGAGAQSHTQGLFLKVHGNASTIRMEDAETTEMRTGFGFGIGYGFRPALAWFINVDAAPGMGGGSIPESVGFAISHAELGGRYTFRDASARWRPSLDVSAAVMMASWERAEMGGPEPVYMELAGFAFGFGGGLAYYFNPKLALNMALRGTVGSFDDHRVENITVHLQGKDRISARTSRFNLGVIWYPSARSEVALQTPTLLPVLLPPPLGEPAVPLRDLEGGAFTPEYFAQVAPVGSRVRLRNAEPPYRVEGSVVGFTADTIILRTGASAPLGAVPIASVSTLDVSVPDRLKGAGNGAVAGMLIGCVAAGLYGAASYPEDRVLAAGYWCTLLGSPLGILPGAVIGALAAPSRKWRAVAPLRIGM
jgi:hypothetical protein